MEYRDALRFLDRHINHEATAGRISGLSLDPMRALVEVLGDPQQAYPVIHLTGTNGKGSTGRMITALLAEHGLSVGSYSSPHLQRVNERLAWNGEPIADDDLARVVTELARLTPLSGTEPSYFELLTAAAYLWFAEIAVDVAVVEVGLLGRYDATNVADADVAVVTNVGQDHTDGQGDWMQRIASEKAGIITPESVLVLGETDPTLQATFLAEGPRLTWRRGEDFDIVEESSAVGGQMISVRTPLGSLDDLFLPLYGRHQGANAACAIAAVEAFFDRPLDAEVAREALATVTMPGRLEVVQRNPLVLLDGAHNPQGAMALAETVAEEFDVPGRRILVVGLLSGRDPRQMLDALDAQRADLLVACTPDSPRAVPAADLAAVAASVPVLTEIVPDPAEALDRALAVCTEDDVVLVAGSLYVAGAARTEIERRLREDM
ncbi:bifunctional folylpolyglutamate synthase/dihydrofolate synthase [Rhabdothermincola salaria]|uniref:bifunctional folylpolyglutamate synthase/dihydrofolate synthase n=1 Tax=Rhabdothermincola salaria TaxID=2903142 RepID=UPI001E3F438B|nr:folylpolyglutamate synthase/dihydrofolate synthase family protein [Rhabdothermincola salaria]MCD9623224.1 bifunctional folylpolyglutamate synthase/dihydrofolate synthase [Rhabdothermincola salaria]